MKKKIINITIAAAPFYVSDNKKKSGLKNEKIIKDGENKRTTCTVLTVP